jgi:hypothetical protein
MVHRDVHVRGIQTTYSPGLRRWLQDHRGGLVAQVAIVLPASETHEGLDPLRGLLATLPSAFQCFPRLVHQLQRNPAPGFGLAGSAFLSIDPGLQLSDVSVIRLVIFALGFPYSCILQHVGI